MTDRKLKWRPTLAAAMVAAVLVAVSCEAPRPEPLAPGASGKTSAAAPQLSAEPYFEFQVEKPVTTAAGSVTPKYPQILREAGVEGEVLVSFVVDVTGQADTSTFKVIRSTHELFSAAVKQALPAMRFVPAEVGGRKVKQMVQEPFTFSIVGAVPKDASSGANGFREVPVQSLPLLIRRSETMSNLDATTVVLSSGGTELARYATTGKREEIKTDDISAIEVYKGSTCASSAQAACPLIRIWLKPGREAAYRKK